MSRDAEIRYRNFEHESWERAAQHYADSYGTFTAPFARPLLDAVGCSSGTRILEIACGTGYISRLATTLGATATGVDFTAAMIAQAKRRRLSGFFAQADAGSLPFAEQSFDAVAIGFGVQHFPSPQLAVSEARRVLRVDGRLAFTVWSSTDNMIQQLLIDGLSEGGLRGWTMPTPPSGEIDSLGTCIGLLSESGFDAEHSSARKLLIGIAVPSAQRLLEIIAISTARGAAILRAQPERVMPAVVTSVEKAMEPFRCPNGKGYELPAVAVLAVAIRN